MMKREKAVWRLIIFLMLLLYEAYEGEKGSEMKWQKMVENGVDGNGRVWQHIVKWEWWKVQVKAKGYDGVGRFKGHV